ncbi:MAG: hypothetical protein V1721_05100 [Pseudomonadota bacterium]
MDQENYIKLVQTLVQKTAQGKVPWKKTSDREKFVSPINSDYSVAIEQMRTDAYEGFEYFFVLTNSRGETIERVSSRELQEFYDALKSTFEYPELNPLSDTLNRLFSAARRQALGVEKAVDSILEALEKDAIVDPDEIPF